MLPNWLPEANNVENDTPVNLASREAGRDLEFAEVDFSHSESLR